MRRKIIFAAMLAFISLAFLSPFLSYKAIGDIGDPNSEQVFLFEHTNYGGNSMSFFINDKVADLTKWKFINSKTTWNDKISSMKIGRNAKIIFYNDINFKKKLSEIEGDGINVKYVPSLHTYGFGDKISSFEVKISSQMK